MIARRGSGKQAEVLRELQGNFTAADDDGDGRIDIAEFANLLDELDAGVSQQELTSGFREVDKDHDGLIDLQEFAAWWVRG